VLLLPSAPGGGWARGALSGVALRPAFWRAVGGGGAMLGALVIGAGLPLMWAIDSALAIGQPAAAGPIAARYSPVTDPGR